jgi:hypothetical protein
MVVVKQASDFLPEEGIISVDFSPVYFLKVPVNVA